MIRYTMLFVAIVAMCVSVNAQIPETVAYQGFYSDSVGNAKPDGNYTFTFRIYDVDSGGAPLWTEIKDLAVKNGLFYTLLGDDTPLLPTLDFNNPYWLGIKPGADPEVAPRVPFTSVPYALIAQTVPDNAVTTTKIADGSVTLDKLNQWGASTDDLMQWNGSEWAAATIGFPGGAYQGFGTHAVPTSLTPAWDSMKIQVPGAGFLQTTTTVTLYLTDATGCPCQYRGVVYVTGEGYTTGYYSDVTLDVLSQRMVLSMTGGIQVPDAGTYNLEIRVHRGSGSGTATGFGNGSAIWVPVNASAGAAPRAAVGENAVEKP